MLCSIRIIRVYSQPYNHIHRVYISVKALTVALVWELDPPCDSKTADELQAGLWIHQSRRHHTTSTTPDVLSCLPS